MHNENSLSKAIIGAAIEVHREQQNVSISYKGVKLATPLQLDLLVEDLVVVDGKARDCLTAFDRAQLLTYLRLTGKRLGLLINFHEIILKNGIRRVANGLPEEPA